MKHFQFSNIKKFREAVNLSQKDLAAKIGISPQQLWNWENSDQDKTLTASNLAKLAEALGKTTDDFFEEAP